MKAIYIDCGMGAAGDMLTAALFGLLPEPEREDALAVLNGAGIPGVRYELEPSVKCGIRGLSVRVKVNGAEEGEEHPHDEEHHHHDDGHHHHDEEHHHHDDGHHHHDEEHHHHDEEHHHHDDGHHHHDDEHHHHHHEHHSMADITEMIRGLLLPDQVKEDALAVYSLLAAAESEAHGIPVGEVHFHEVGMLDAVADVTAVSYLFYRLGADRVISSPVTTGSGTVRCAHGILPVPAPATANILRGIPSRSGEKEGELCTPTGAALIRHFADGYGMQPAMTAEAAGYGMGKKDFRWANCVRVLSGELYDESGEQRPGAGAEIPGMRTEDVLLFSCNLDDMTGEEIAWASEQLFREGALDVWTTAACMKKSRPGTVLHVLCLPEKRDSVLRSMFRCTATLGIREESLTRHVLSRHTETVGTPDGPVRKKVSEGYGARTEKYEYDDLAAIAAKSGKTLTEIRRDLWLTEKRN